MNWNNFKGAAKRLDDIDLPTLGSKIGVGEDEIHAFLDVETRGSGFDSQGRPAMLFEPHVFYKYVPKNLRQRAVNQGLAYAKWGGKPYPKESYTRLLKAIAIDETAALKSCSWGLGQVMGYNHEAAGYATVDAMVAAFMSDEENQLEAAINFIKKNKLDDELRRHDWAGFARGYNGPGYAKNRYDLKLAEAFKKWSRIKDIRFPDVSQIQPIDVAPKSSNAVKEMDALVSQKQPELIDKPVSVAPIAVKQSPFVAFIAFILSLFKRKAP